MPGIGDNISGAIKEIVDRVERLEAEKKAIADDIKDVYAEAKAQGFDTKILRKVVALRKLDPAKRMEQQSILEVYMQALGDLADTPLGKAALERDGF